MEYLKNEPILLALIALSPLALFPPLFSYSTHPPHYITALLPSSLCLLNHSWKRDSEDLWNPPRIIRRGPRSRSLHSMRANQYHLHQRPHFSRATYSRLMSLHLSSLPVKRGSANGCVSKFGSLSISTLFVWF